MCCTNNPLETPLLDPISKQPGKHKDNTSKATRVNSLKSKVLARPPSIPPLCQKHGITNQSPWTLTEPGHQGETGEDEEEVRKGET